MGAFGAGRSSIRIGIVEDELFVARCLSELLQMEPDFDVVGCAAGADEAVRLARDQLPDVLLLDVDRLPQAGADVARTVRGAVPEIRMVVLMSHATSRLIRTLGVLGVSGFLSKTAAAASVGELTGALRTVHTGAIYVQPAIAQLLVAPPEPEVAPTPRELEVLVLAARGHSDKEIARQLGVSPWTVRAHYRKLFRSARVGSRAGLLARAIAAGWIGMETYKNL